MRFLIFNRILPLLTFPPVIFALAGYLVSLIVPISIELWDMVFLLSIVFCLGILSGSKTVFSTPQAESSLPSWQVIVLIVLPLLVLIPGMYATLVDTSVQTTVHADFHTSLINQIMHGTFPPVNPQIPDLPIGYYWLYHSLLAVPTHLLGVAAPIVSASLNLISLICSLFWVGLLVQELGFESKRPFVLGCMVILVLFSGNLFGVFHALDSVTLDVLVFGKQRAMVLAGDERLYGLWVKYLHFNSVPLSLLYFVSGLLAVVRLAKGNHQISTVYLLAFGMVGGIIFQLGTGFFLIITTFPALGLIYLLHRIQNLSKLSIPVFIRDIIADVNATLAQYTLVQILVSIAGLVFLLVTTLVVGLRVLSLFPGASTFSLTSQFNLESVVSMNYPLLPFFLITAGFALRKNDRLSQFFVIATFIGMVVSYTFILSDNNQYKFVLLTSILMGATACRAFYWLMIDQQSKRIQQVGKGLLILAITLIWANITLISMSFVLKAIDGKQQYQYDGRYIMRDDSEYKDTFIWIRENTPPDTLVIQPIEMEAFYTAMFTERLPYLGVYQFEFSKGIAEYDDRLAALDLFYNPASTINQRIEAIQKFRAIESDRSLILAVPNAIPIPQDQILNLGFSLAYEADNTTLYWLRQDGEFVPMAYLDANPQLNTIFTFGDETISLQGIQLEIEQTIAPCESFWVSTWWQTSQPQDIDYLMKLVLVDAESSQVLTHSDAVPSATFMTDWLPDTIYSDTRNIDVPCDADTGEYLLLMGMYEVDYETLEFVADLPVFYQDASVGNLGFLQSLVIE